MYTLIESASIFCLFKNTNFEDNEDSDFLDILENFISPEDIDPQDLLELSPPELNPLLASSSFILEILT